MTSLLRRLAVAGALAIAATAPAAAATAAPTRSPAVLHVGQIARQDIANRLGSEPDTLVEPDVAVDPTDSQVAIAVAHDGRYSDGGAVGISASWTHDGGRTWRHAPVPYITKGVGGRWSRASDPVLAFGPDGTAYLSVLVFEITSCSSAVVVLRSTDGGRTWSRPVTVHEGGTCTVSDDKNWIVADTSPASPYFGRVYQFWTPVFLTPAGGFLSAPQAVRWSDDKGRHWSGTHFVSARGQDTQDSQPMIRRDGTIVDAYMRYPAGAHDEDEAGRVAGAAAARSAAAAGSGVAFVARRSSDGGATWGAETVIVRDLGADPAGVRCCLPSAVADPTSGHLFAVWMGASSGSPVQLSRSTDGRHWSSGKTISRDGAARTMTHVNADVTAHSGRVFVTYGTRDVSVAAGRYVQQQVTASYDDGKTFGTPIALGTRSDLHYAAFARGQFPGDYIGSAASATRVYLGWAHSSRPPDGTGRFHQTLYAAVLAP